MEDSHQKQYKIIDSDDLDMLGTIIAAKASEEREQQQQQTQQQQPPPLPVQAATDKEAKRPRRKKSSHLEVPTQVEEEGKDNLTITRTGRHSRISKHYVDSYDT